MGEEENAVPLPSPHEQRIIIKKYADDWDTLEEGESAYLISKTWYDTWKTYSDDSEPTLESPPKIDNSDIIYQHKKTELTHNQVILKPKLQENVDFVVLSEIAWETFSKWYGGGPKIKRKVISEGTETKCTRVEIYFVRIKISLPTAQGTADPKKTITIYESKNSTLQALQDFASSNLHVDKETTRLWNALGTPYEPLWDKLTQTIGETEITQDQTILLDHKVNGDWILKSPKSGTKRGLDKVKSIYSGVVNFLFASAATIDRATTAASIPNISGDRSQLKLVPGVCGLTNLGNTCFMNSALQCLSNCEPLTVYFINNEYKLELNEDNPLGMKGNLAEQYAVTVKHMWSGSYHSVVPRNLKNVVGRFAPRFSGYSQQDSQEFLGFLLDGLHEDLNRVRKKPYTTTPDETGERPDAIVAKEAWERHLMRNQSAIVDLFQAQLKSTLVCPRCSYVSVIFDPFMYLSLPLPAKNLYEAVLIDSSFAKIPNIFGARLSTYANVSNLFDSIEQESGVVAANLFAVLVRNQRIAATLKRGTSVCSLPSKDPGKQSYSPATICVYNIPVEYQKLQRIHVLHRKNSISRFKTATKELIGNPLVMFIPELTGRELYFLVWKRVQRLVKPEDRDPRFCSDSRGKSFEECMEEDPSCIWEWIKEESQKDFHPEELPIELSLSSSFGTSCTCRGLSKCKCKIIGDDEIVKFDGKNFTIAVDWLKAECYSTENGNTHIPSPSLLQLRSEHQRSNTIKLEDCLDLFNESETLGENDKWYCPKCKDHVQANKKMDLWNSPQFLIIHLKRFSQAARSKITTPVRFPLEGLDLDPFLLCPESKGAKYDLFAISHHSGALNGGHYTANARNPNGKWYTFNDSSTRPSAQPNGSSSSAYLLFYQKRTAPVGVVSKKIPKMSNGCNKEEPQEKTTPLVTSGGSLFKVPVSKEKSDTPTISPRHDDSKVEPWEEID